MISSHLMVFNNKSKMFLKISDVIQNFTSDRYRAHKLVEIHDSISVGRD